MENSELQIKYDRLIDKIIKYRGYQKQWLKYHASSDLQKVKIFAREIDKLISEEVKQQESKQPEIF